MHTPSFWIAMGIACFCASALAIIICHGVPVDDPFEDFGNNLSDDPWLAAMVDRTLRSPDLPSFHDGASKR